MKLELYPDHAYYPDISASYALTIFSDFKEEVGAREKLICNYSHIIELSLKGHKFF